jgi:hypothetical protein
VSRRALSPCPLFPALFLAPCPLPPPPLPHRGSATGEGEQEGGGLVGHPGRAEPPSASPQAPLARREATRGGGHGAGHARQRKITYFPQADGTQLPGEVSPPPAED